MAESEKACVICGDEEREADAPLIQSPCERHFLCVSCLEDMFRIAMNDEKHYPPQCCKAIFLVGELEDFLDFTLVFEYKVKEQGEYSLQPRFRVYCANSACVTRPFLRPDSYLSSKENPAQYAVCDACTAPTCVDCKTLVQGEPSKHQCEVTEAEKQFQKAVQEQGWKECVICGKFVELAEACNHMMCTCGAQFCYVCGKTWEGIHGCPQYGPAKYDEEGYNQDGFHKETGLNREGQTRRQQMIAEGGGDSDDEEDVDSDEEGWMMDAEMRAILDTLPEDEREEAFQMFQLEMIERRQREETDGQDNNGAGEDAEDADAQSEADSIPASDHEQSSEEEEDTEAEAYESDTISSPTDQESDSDSDSDDTVTSYPLGIPPPHPNDVSDTITDYSRDIHDEFADDTAPQSPTYTGGMPGAFPLSDRYSATDLAYNPSEYRNVSEPIDASRNTIDSRISNPHTAHNDEDDEYLW